MPEMIRLLPFLLATALLHAQPANLPANAVIQPDQVVKAGTIKFESVRGPLSIASQQRYIGITFEAHPGDRVVVLVRMKDGKPDALLTDSTLKPIAVATSKEPSGERGMYLRATLPLGDKTTTETYYVLVREALDHGTTFTVDLRHDQQAPQEPRPQAAAWSACRQQSDCVVVPKAGCCRNGYIEAVNKDQIAAYNDANACKDMRAMCPQFQVVDERVAHCNTDAGVCELVQKSR